MPGADSPRAAPLDAPARATYAIALGGHALVRDGRADLDAQRAALRVSLAVVVELIERGHRVLLAHGNGPQVGHALLRAERARGEAYPLPMEYCVAQTQGELGFLIVHTLRAMLRARGMGALEVAALLTTVEVARDDPHLATPTKPVGPTYDAARADELRAAGMFIALDGARGLRRMVPSPRPLRVLEARAIRAAVDAGVVLVAGGGGGVPVLAPSPDDAGDVTSGAGVAAVVDKDYTAALLARLVDARVFLNLTAVEHVGLDHGTPRARPIARMTAREARDALALGHFAAGSMGPKVEAAVEFVRAGGERAVITLPERAREALDGAAGTEIVPD